MPNRGGFVDNRVELEPGEDHPGETGVFGCLRYIERQFPRTAPIVSIRSTQRRLNGGMTIT